MNKHTRLSKNSLSEQSFVMKRGTLLPGNINEKSTQGIKKDLKGGLHGREREAQLRLNALKEHDMGGYLQLAKDTRNTQLEKMLSDTSACLQILASRVFKRGTLTGSYASKLSVITGKGNIVPL